VFHTHSIVFSVDAGGCLTIVVSENTMKAYCKIRDGIVSSIERPGYIIKM